MSSTKLFDKHFGKGKIVVDLKHPKRHKGKGNKE